MKSSCYILYICFLISSSSDLIDADASFNYEISYRVKENVELFLEKIAQVTTLPSYSLESGQANLADFYNASIFLPASIMFFNVKLMFKSEVSLLQIGFENKVYYSIQNDVSTYPYSLVADANNRSHPDIVYGYSLKYNGLPEAPVDCDADPANCPFPFDVRKRPWYIQGKAAQTRIWTKPFLQVEPTLPVVSLVNPIMKTTTSGNQIFLGAIAANIHLDQISTYLVKSYKDSNKEVFILNVPSGYLIASSLDAKLYTSENTLIVAADSENDIIAGATSKLIEKGWPDYLIIYQDYYLQSVLYNDSVPGIVWHIVVLLPANVVVDHLSADSKLYNVVIGIASLSIAFAVLGACITLYYIQSRLIKLTRPVFTLIILTGAVLMSIYCILLLGANSSVSCAARPWLFNLAFTLSISPLLIKAYMVHLLFNVNPLSKNKLIGTHILVVYTLLLVVVDAILVALTCYVGNTGTRPISVTELTSNGAYAEVVYCSTTKNKVFLYVEIVFKGLLVGSACVLSFLVRKIPGTIAGSKVLLVVVYNIACISGGILLIIHSVSDVGIMIICQVIGICVCAMITTVSLVGPTFYELVTVGDKQAADDVISEIFNGRKDGENGSREKNKSTNFPRETAVTNDNYVFKADKNVTSRTVIMSSNIAPNKVSPRGIGTGLGSDNVIVSDKNKSHENLAIPAIKVHGISRDKYLIKEEEEEDEESKGSNINDGAGAGHIGALSPMTSMEKAEPNFGQSPIASKFSIPKKKDNENHKLG